jgi:signal transduction histidine kinase
MTIEPRSQPIASYFSTLLTVGCVALVLLIGVLDYATGDDISLSVIYVLPIAIGTWYLGGLFGWALSIASVLVWMAGNLTHDYSSSSWLIPVWNCVIRIILYAMIIQLLMHVRRLTLNLEQNVAARTSELRREIAERRRLEDEMLTLSERERCRLGYDLHDGLCQHLTGTALVTQALKAKLEKGTRPEVAEMSRVIALIEEAIVQSRNLAAGLQPVALGHGGLMQALEEFATYTEEMFRVSCIFECEAPIIVADAAVADHLYHIVREGTANAVRHSRGQHIRIGLEANEECLTLSIEDDGIGVSPPACNNGGMGIRNMEQRAKMIGAKFVIQSRRQRGTLITCRVPTF